MFPEKIGVSPNSYDKLLVLTFIIDSTTPLGGDTIDPPNSNVVPPSNIKNSQFLIIIKHTEKY